MSFVYKKQLIEETLIEKNISSKVISCYTYNDSKTKHDTSFWGSKCFAILYMILAFLFTCKLYFYISR